MRTCCRHRSRPGNLAGRLKFNGRLLARSPLSDLEELELLLLGVEGKAAGWRTLRTLADTDTRLDAGRLDELISRAACPDRWDALSRTWMLYLGGPCGS
jgi:hypothetical protein